MAAKKRRPQRLLSQPAPDIDLKIDWDNPTAELARLKHLYAVTLLERFAVSIREVELTAERLVHDTAEGLVLNALGLQKGYNGGYEVSRNIGSTPLSRHLTDKIRTMADQALDGVLKDDETLARIRKNVLDAALSTYTYNYQQRFREILEKDAMERADADAEEFLRKAVPHRGHDE